MTLFLEVFNKYLVVFKFYRTFKDLCKLFIRLTITQQRVVGQELRLFSLFLSIVFGRESQDRAACSAAAAGERSMFVLIFYCRLYTAYFHGEAQEAQYLTSNTRKAILLIIVGPNILN